MFNPILQLAPFSNNSSLLSLPSPGLLPESSVSPLLVQDFAVVMIVAAVMLGLTYKLRQPMVLGYSRRYDDRSIYATIQFDT